MVVLTTWAWVSSQRYVRPLFLPSPADLYQSFINLLPVLPEAILSSTFMTLAGFLIGTSVGLASGLLMAYSAGARFIMGGVLGFVRPVPTYALIPLFVLWFGIGRAPQIAIIAVGTSLIIGLVTIEAIKNVPPIFIRASLVLGASRSMIYRSIIVPAIIPHMLGAVRAAGAVAWGLDVAAEFIGAQNGLGRLIIVRQEFLDTSSMIVIIIIYSLLAMITDLIIRKIEVPLTAWTGKYTQTGAVSAVVGTA
jgi:ABC-type nitrate/sulfonate/bicarbonate transport system permease component